MRLSSMSYQPEVFPLHMNIAGEITVAAPRQQVFRALRNAAFFASCIDGVRDLKEVDPTHFDAVLETRIAYMRFSFKVSVEMTRVAEPDEIEGKIEGAPLGVAGRLTATAKTQLSESGADTVIRYTIDTTLTGKLGSIGQPVLKAKAREMEKQFTERLRAAFAEGKVPEAAQ
jgi:carbon monoxide dehydrogenase subunit G